MNTICPRCGKGDTIPFSDSVLHTVGFECANCHQDFGVDDEKKKKKREEKGKFSIFYFSKTDNHISFLKDKLNGSLSEIEVKEIFNNLF